MVAREPALSQIWDWLGAVPDPEIPVISIVDLGIVRDVSWSVGAGSRTLRVALTPTYSGCPAIRQIELDVVAALRERGIEDVELTTRLSPAWTTDWIGAAAREKLRAYGISPPGTRARDPLAPLDLSDILAATQERVRCPRCASQAVELVSRFASTACKAHYRCTSCREPFDHFKSH